MDKQKFLNLISLYIDGDLSTHEIKEVENFISNNPELKKNIDNIQNIIGTLGSTDELKTSRNFMVNLNSKIDTYESKKNMFSKFFDFISINRNRLLIPSIGMSLSIIMIFVSTIYISKNNSFNNKLVEYEKNKVGDLDLIDSLDVDGQKIRLVGGNND